MNLLDARPLRLRGSIVTVVKGKNRRVPALCANSEGVLRFESCQNAISHFHSGQDGDPRHLAATAEGTLLANATDAC